MEEALRLYSLIAEWESLEHNPEVVAFAGAVTSAEVEEVKAYLRERR